VDSHHLLRGLSQSRLITTWRWNGVSTSNTVLTELWAYDNGIQLQKCRFCDVKIT